MSRLSAVGKYVGRALGAVLLLLVLLALALQVPAVQTWLARQATGYLAKQVQTPIRIDRVRINLFGGDVSLYDLYVEDQQEDTLLLLHQLEVGIRMRALLGRRLLFDNLQLRRGVGKMYPVGPEDSGAEAVMNYQFLADAFSSDDPAPEPSGGSSWSIGVANAAIALESVRFYMELPDSTLELELDLGAFEGGVASADINRMQYDVSRLALRDTDFRLRLGETDEEEEAVEDPDSTIAALHVALRQMDLSGVSYAMEMPGLTLSAEVGTAAMNELDLGLLNDSIAFGIPSFRLANGAFRYDVPDSTRREQGLDYNHLALDSIQIELGETRYDDQDIEARVLNLAARLPGALELRSLDGLVQYSPEAIAVSDFQAATAGSRLELPDARLAIPASGAAAELGLRLDLALARIDPVELAYLVPALQAYPWLRVEEGGPIELRARLDGSLEQMALGRFDLRGWGLRLAASGQLEHLTEPERLGLALDLDPLQIQTAALRRHLPDSLLPADADLPEGFWAQSRFEGDSDSLAFRLLAQTSRPEAPVSARLRVRGYATTLFDPDALAYHTWIDTLLITREELRAQLGPNASSETDLPEGIELQAEISGSADSVGLQRLALRERRPGPGIEIGMAGGVAFPDTVRPLRFAARIDSLIAPASSVAAYLPDTLLPEALRVPGITRLQGSASGTPSDLEARVDLEVQGARLAAEAWLADSVYRGNLRLDSFQLAYWLREATYDSLVGIPVVPLGFDLALRGEGFEPGPDFNADLTARLSVQDTTRLPWSEGLYVSGSAEGYDATLSAVVSESGAEGELAASANFHPDSSLRLGLSLLLDRIDLQALRLSRAPMRIRGALEWQSQGSQPEDIRLQAGLRDLQFVYDTLQGQIQGLDLAASYQDRQARAELRSEILNAQLVGQFDYGDLAPALRRSLRSHFVPVAEMDTLPGQPGDFLEASIQLDEPELLTRGLVPDLTELDTGSIELSYTRDNNRIDLNLKLPRIAYRGLALDSLGAHFLADTAQLAYGLGFFRLTGPAEFEVVNLDITGRIAEDATTVNRLRQRNPAGEDRFLVEADLRRQQGITSIRFQPEVLLNYETWTLPESNQITIFADSLIVSDWRLQRDEQVVALEDEADGKDLRLALQAFRLDLLGNALRDGSEQLGGATTGSLRVRQLLDKPRVEADLEVDTLRVFESRLGTFGLALTQEDSSGWRGGISLLADSSELALEGYYRPLLGDEALDIRLRTDPLRLEPLQPLSFGTFNALSGALYSNLEITGSPEAPRLDGFLRFVETSLTPSQLNTPFRLGDETVTFSTSEGAAGRSYRVDFDQLTIQDAQGNLATLRGGLQAEGLAQYQIDMEIGAERFLVLNSTEEDNELYYGQLRLNLDGEVSGRLDSIDLKLLVEPTDESTFTYVSPINTLADTESWEGIITFESPQTPDSSLAFFEPPLDTVVETSRELGLYLTLNAALNDELEVTLITDPVAGDYFQGKADGNLSISMRPNRDLELVGQMNVTEGTYLFTYTELVKREFSVLPSSTITWTGDPMEPDLALAAKYTSRARPATLVAKYSGSPSDAAEERLNRRQEFDVIFNISGELEDFSIDTDIEYPRNNFNRNLQEIVNAIETLNQDESETNSQAFSLLLFNSFLATAGSNSGASLVNLQQSFSDILTGYLNSLADQYVNFIEIDIDLESSGEGLDNYLEETDLRVSLRKRFLNDRVEIRVDGVASSQEYNSADRDGDSDLQAYLDNITVEYSLNQDGNLKIRVYNKRDTEDLLGGEVVKLGGGLVFSKSFNRLNIFGPRADRQPAGGPN